MAYIEVVGGKHLHGEVCIQGSKNAVLPILAASILNKGTTILNHCPRIKDIFSMIKILESIGCSVHWEGDSILIDAKNITSDTVSEKYVSTMRSSIILMGALLGRMQSVTISYPGGCSIGERPIDLHLKALKELQIEITEKDERIFCNTKKIQGNRIDLGFPSVGATENIILTAVLSEGVTTIENAAKEPEVAELCTFLKLMGGKIEGEGTACITIHGVKKLHDIEYTMAADRIVMGTYMSALAGTGGDITLKGNCCLEQKSVLEIMRSLGCRIGCGKDYINICTYERPKSLTLLETSPYPGFPTDMQSQIMSVLTLAQGSSVIFENIFEARYKNAAELRKMGAKIIIKGNFALIKGVEELYGTEIIAHDLRGGAALVIAGIMAQDKTIIKGVEYIERGYESIVRDLKLLGADIKLMATKK